MSQIFKKKNIKKSKFKNIENLQKYNLNKIFLKYFNFFDKKEIIINNFIYLLRLNNLNEKKYFQNILHIKFFIVFYFIKKYNLKNNLFLNKIIKINIFNILKKFNKKNIKKIINNNYEIFFFKNKKNKELKKYNNYNYLYNNISNIFVQPFLNLKNYLSYYKYFYFLTMLINIIFIKKKLKDNKNIEIFKIKLKIISKYNLEISNITNIYFNYFIQINNFFLKKYK